MRKTIKITNTNEYKQLRDIFHDAFVRDIDFTHWYKRIRFIVECNEYLGNDFPLTGVFALDFEGVRFFSLNLSEKKNIFEADGLDESVSEPRFQPSGLKEYTQECTNEKRKFYRILFSGCKPLDSLEIHYDSLQTIRLCDCDDIEGNGIRSLRSMGRWRDCSVCNMCAFFTLDSKKKFYEMLKHKYKIEFS